MMMALQTARLTLRPPKPADEDAFIAYYTSPRRVAQRGSMSVNNIWRFFAALLGHWTIRDYGRFIVEDGGQAIACIGPNNPTGYPEPEIAWHVWSTDHEGKGYASEAARAALTHAYRDLGWTTAVSYILPGNTRSIALAERLGATADPDAETLAGTDRIVYRHAGPEVFA